MEEERILAVGRALGKREMLLYIQRACVAKGGALTLEDINKYSQVVDVDEMIWQDEIRQFEMEVDKDVRHASRQICEGV